MSGQCAVNAFITVAHVCAVTLDIASTAVAQVTVNLDDFRVAVVMVTSKVDGVMVTDKVDVVMVAVTSIATGRERVLHGCVAGLGLARGCRDPVGPPDRVLRLPQGSLLLGPLGTAPSKHRFYQHVVHTAWRDLEVWMRKGPHWQAAAERARAEFDESAGDGVTKTEGSWKAPGLLPPAAVLALLAIIHPDKDAKLFGRINRLQISWMLERRGMLDVREGFWKGLNSENILSCFAPCESHKEEVFLRADYSQLFGGNFPRCRWDIRPYLPFWARLLNLTISTAAVTDAKGAVPDPRTRTETIDIAEEPLDALRRILFPDPTKVVGLETWLQERLLLGDESILLAWCNNWAQRLGHGLSTQHRVIMRSLFQQSLGRLRNLCPSSPVTMVTPEAYMLLDMEDSERLEEEATGATLKLNKVTKFMACKEATAELLRLINGNETASNLIASISLRKVLHFCNIMKDPVFTQHALDTMSFDELRTRALIQDLKEHSMPRDGPWPSSNINTARLEALKLTTWQQMMLIVPGQLHNVLTEQQQRIYHALEPDNYPTNAPHARMPSNPGNDLKDQTTNTLLRTLFDTTALRPLSLPPTPLTSPPTPALRAHATANTIVIPSTPAAPTPEPLCETHPREDQLAAVATSVMALSTASPALGTPRPAIHDQTIPGSAGKTAAGDEDFFSEMIHSEQLSAAVPPLATPLAGCADQDAAASSAASRSVAPVECDEEDFFADFSEMVASPFSERKRAGSSLDGTPPKQPKLDAGVVEEKLHTNNEKLHTNNEKLHAENELLQSQLRLEILKRMKAGRNALREENKLKLRATRISLQGRWQSDFDSARGEVVEFFKNHQAQSSTELKEGLDRVSQDFSDKIAALTEEVRTGKQSTDASLELLRTDSSRMITKVQVDRLADTTNSRLIKMQDELQALQEQQTVAHQAMKTQLDGLVADIKVLKPAQHTLQRQTEAMSMEPDTNVAAPAQQNAPEPGGAGYLSRYCPAPTDWPQDQKSYESLCFQAAVFYVAELGMPRSGVSADKDAFLATKAAFSKVSQKH